MTEPLKVTIPEMERLVFNEARRIRIIQEELIRVGDRATHDSGQIRNAEIFEALYRLLGLCRAPDVSAALARAVKAPS